ncbi:MFS transporter [Kineococcus arenarius]|uniref:MFS transporter n=1 Tax=Kineococcus sp. SYSU DK007 TaxID=3383128 RepID=UPI003D7D1248
MSSDLSAPQGPAPDAAGVVPTVPGAPPATVPVGDAAGPLAALDPRRRRTLMGSLLATHLFLFATYAGVVVILLPQQVAELDPVRKAANLAVVTATSSVFTLFAQPIVGAFSDRTRSRFGRRSPWLVLGGIAGGLLTICVQFAPSLFWITAVWVLAQVALNALQGPLSAVIADRVEDTHRATASAFVGVGTAVGATAGVVLAGQLLNRLGLGYTLFGVLVAVFAVLFAVLNRDTASTGLRPAPFAWGAFAKSFWISPRRHPDYAWAFAGRFAMILGYQAVSAYQFYILTDYIGLDAGRAGTVAGLLSLCAMVTTVVGTLVFGRISDRLNRRKVFVFLATIVMGLGVVIPLISPTVVGMVLYSLVLGIGYGAYIAVDLALMIDVLPSGGDAAKDLGVLNVATNVPQALTPPIAALLLLTFDGDYAAIFVWSALAVVVSSLFVLPIKSVR